MNEVQLLGYIKFFACLQVLILPVNEFLQPEIKLQLLIKYCKFSVDILDVVFRSI